MQLRLLTPALLLVVAASNAGCYKSYRLGDDAPVDLGPDARVDLGPIDFGPDAHIDLGPDAFIEVDFGPDARVDLGADMAREMGIGIDAEPPLGPPPDPTLCRTTPAILPFEDPVLERSWPDGTVVHSDALNVCMTPLVIDVDPDGTTVEPEIVFVSYPTLRRDEPPGILRIWSPKTRNTVSYPAGELEQGVFEATAGSYFVDRAGGDDAPVIDHGHVITHPLDQIHHVAGEHDRAAT